MNRIIVLTCVFALAFAGSMLAQPSNTSPAEASATQADGKKPLAERAALVLERQMAENPDRRIPRKIRDDAKCVAVFPSVIEGGLIIAAKRGHGVVSCRDAATGAWSAPAALNLSAGSVGLQAGVQKASIILLFMKDKAVESLLDGSKGSFGGDIGVTAGPIGGSAGIDSQPAVISYSRSKGLFAGIDLEGAKITFAKRNGDLYHEGVTAREVLAGSLPPADEVAVFHRVLTSFAGGVSAD